MGIKQHIREMHEYKPPLEGRSSSNCLLLDFNERTTPVPAHIKEALIRYIESDRIHLYPEYDGFLELLAAYTSCPAAQLLITNGSDQAIDVVYRAHAEPCAEAIVPAPTFAMLSHAAELEGLKLLQPAYTEQFEYPLEDVLAAVSERTKVIVVCNPNSPTGTLVAPQDILKLAAAAPHAAILVDECYFEYSKVSVQAYLAEHRNLFITRTFSKTWGLPSLRLGYLMSHPDNISELLKVRGPYDINRLAVVAATAALKHPEYMESYVREVLDEAKPLLESFLSSKGIRFWPSAANFLLLYPPTSDDCVTALKEKGILVRPRNGPGIEGTIRITIGTRKQTEQLISALESIWG